MATEIIPYTTEDAWLAARAQDVTSTEVSALFNASPYRTAFELYYEKTSGVRERWRDNPRAKWGRRLQDPIAAGVAEDLGVDVRHMREYIRDPAARLGSSFDFEILPSDARASGILEIKSVDPFIFRDQWVIEDGVAIEAPTHIELQVQHQMLVSGRQWALIAALVGKDRVSVIERAYDPKLAAGIFRKVREIWTLVDAGTPPAPDYARDAETIARLYINSTAGKVLDARQDEQLAAWVDDYQSLGIDIRARVAAREARRAQIIERIGDAARVLLPESTTISAGTVREAVVPAHTRSAYRSLRVNQPKEKRA